MKIQLFGGVALAAALVATGSWASENGWYGAIDGGVHKADHMSASSPGLPDYVISSPYNVVGFGRIGYRVSPYLRLEVEGGYRAGAVNHVTSEGASIGSICNVNSPNGVCNSPGGAEHAWTVMGNALVDLLPNSRITPFVGGGVGWFIPT